MERNRLFDCLKGIGCLGVVFMHIKFPGIWGELIHETAQFAVPLFILIAGFYAYGCTTALIKRKAKRIFVIFLVSFSLFLIYNILRHVVEGNLLEWCECTFNGVFFIKLLVFCTIDFAIPLWYLVAMIETYVLWIVVVIKNKEALLIKLLPWLFVFHILFTMICETLSLPWFVKTNFISNCLSYYVLGYYLREKTLVKNLSTNKMKMLVFMTMVGLFFTLLQVVVKFPVDFSCLSIAIYSIGLFLLAMSYPKVSLGKYVEYI